MNSVTTSSKGILVLAGLFDPCGDIGTQCRYDLLPIPWDKTEFVSWVANIIHFEVEQKKQLESQAEECPKAPSDVEDLARGIGLKGWLIIDPDSRILNELLVRGWTEMLGKKAAKEIDHLSFCVPAIKFEWPHINPDDEIAIGQFESLLLNQFESF